jgi:hypothetical protein
MSSDLQALGTSIRANKKAEATRKQYASMANILREWLIKYNPECVENENKIILPLNTNTLELFLSHLTQKTDIKTGNYLEGKFNSVAHIGGYRSMIKDLYTTNQITVDASTERMFTEFMGGYARKVQF